jgi:type II secretory pathway component PulK
MKKLSGQLPLRSAAKNKASILIVALWSVSLLSAFAIILNSQVRQSLVLAKRLEQKDKLRFIAQAGIQKGIMEIKNTPSKAYDWLGDSWSNNPALFKGIEVGDGEFTLSYSSWDSKSSLRRINYGCVDEERKININKAEKTTLERLFKAVLACEDQEAQELAACVLDWRDADSELTMPLSAEHFYYSGLPASYAAKNAEFEVPDELLLVKGFSDNVFEKIKDYVTIYGEGRVNANTASEEALFALGLDEDMAHKFILFRAGKDGQDGTLDDNVFAAASEILPRFGSAYPFTGSQIEQLNRVVALSLGVSSQYFLIRSSAKIGLRYTLNYVSAVNRKGKILYWKEE